MSILRIYLRVLALLAPEKWLAITLAVANLALAGVFFLEPWLFGRVVDGLDVVEKLEAVPVNGETPVTRVEVKKVTVVRQP